METFLQAVVMGVFGLVLFGAGAFLASCYWKANMHNGWVFFDGKAYSVREE